MPCFGGGEEVKTFPWYPLVFGVGIVLAGMVSYYSSQVSIAAELGNRPTRGEMREAIKEYTVTAQRELDTIKESQKETREDMRAIRRYMDEQSKRTHSSHDLLEDSGLIIQR